MVRVALCGVLLLSPPLLWAASLPEAVVVLDVAPPSAPGVVPEAAPPRFVLMEDGTIFVGGTSHVATGQLDKGEMKEIDKEVSRVRKLSGLGSSVVLSPGTQRYRLVLRKGPEIGATGDPALAPAHLKPLASFLKMLAEFDHPSLRPYRPAQYALVAKPGPPFGGCRPWGFGPPPSDGAAQRTVTADAASDWPTGAAAASVCAGDKTYVVTLRPILPGERP